MGSIQIIGFCGVIGSGKDYKAKDFLLKNPDSIQINFADALREWLWKIIKWKPSDDREYEDFKLEEFFSDEDDNNEYYSFTGRDLLIGIGNGMREMFDPDFWITQWAKRIYKTINYQYILVSDVRYRNECEYIVNILGGKIIFCNFKSDKYNPFLDSNSEKLSQELNQKGYKDGEDISMEFKK